MTLVRKLAMLAVAAYFVVCVTAAAVDVDEERLQDVHIDMAGESLGRRMLGLGGTRALKGVSETDAADCGGAGQPVCSGDQLNGREFECDFGFSGLDGECVPFVVKAEIQAEQAAPLQRDVKPEFVPQPEATVAQTPTTPTTPPTTPATPPPAATPTTPPSGGSDALPDNLGMGSGGCSDPMVQEMIALDNKDRAAGGAGPLQCDDTVCKLALEHSKSQCERRSMDHFGLLKAKWPEGRGGQMSTMGYKTRAENVFWNESPLAQQPEATHARLMQSQYHRENLMDPAFTAVGYGYYVCNNGPTVAEDVNGNFNPVGPYDMPVMYHTGTFGGSTA